MSSNDRQENEGFNSEIDSAVESFFSHYEKNAPKVDPSSHEAESDTLSAEESAPEMDDSDSSLEPIFAMLSDAENAPEKPKSGSDRHEKKKFDPSGTFVFKTLTEAILTVDWEVSDANVGEARKILGEIQTKFPVLKESRAQKVVDSMMAILDSIAASPKRVSTSAIAQLEKAIPILRGIASGAQVEDGYDELIEDVIAGLEACRPEDEPVEEAKADSPDPAHDEIPFDNGDGATSKAEELEPIAVPVEISRTLSDHSKVLAQLTPRARRLSDLYAAAQGSENVQALLQKICGLLELQTRALEDGFSLNCDIAIFPIGKINNLSDFLDFQLKAMGVCVRHARVLERTFKKQPHRKKFRQSIYFIRIAMEKQMDELSGTGGGADAAALGTESTVPPPL